MIFWSKGLWIAGRRIIQMSQMWGSSRLGVGWRAWGSILSSRLISDFLSVWWKMCIVGLDCIVSGYGRLYRMECIYHGPKSWISQVSGFFPVDHQTPGTSLHGTNLQYSSQATPYLALHRPSSRIHRWTSNPPIQITYNHTNNLSVPTNAHILNDRSKSPT